jgi:predicted transcriptional regulator
MEALGILTERHPLSVADLAQALAAQGRELAYTTVMTVLARLHAKGVVTRRKAGRQFLYAPAKTAAKTSETLVSRVHRTLFKSERLKPIVSLLKQADDLTEQELTELRALVDQKLKARKGTP